jgi:hypothetical protein
MVCPTYGCEPLLFGGDEACDASEHIQSRTGTQCRSPEGKPEVGHSRDSSLLRFDSRESS